MDKLKEHNGIESSSNDRENGKFLLNTFKYHRFNQTPFSVSNKCDAVLGGNEKIPQEKKEEDKTKKRETPVIVLDKPTQTNSSGDQMAKLTKKPSLGPIRILRKGKKTQVVFKKQIYKKIKSHILDKYRKTQTKFRRKRLLHKRQSQRSKSGKTNINIPDKPEEVTVKHQPVTATTFEGITDTEPNPTSNSDLSTDLFVSIPEVASNSESLSPTEAFLMNFPVVSAGKLAEQEAPVQDNPSVKSKSNTKPQSAEQISTRLTEIPFESPSMSTGIRGLPPLKVFDGITPFLSTLPLLDITFEVPDKPPFSFSLTTSTTTTTSSLNLHPVEQRPDHNVITQAIPNNYAINEPVQHTIPHEGSTLLSTDTKTTNSWSYQTKKDRTGVKIPEEKQPTSISCDLPLRDFTSGAPSFTFSLTKSTNTAVPSKVNSHQQMSCGLFNANLVHSTGNTMTPISSTNNMIFDNYSAPPPFNAFSSSILNGPTTVLPPPDCQYSTNSFSFQLTSASTAEPTYTPVVYSAPAAVPLNQFMSAPQVSSGGGGSKRSNNKPIIETNSKRDKNNHRRNVVQSNASVGLEKKKPQSNQAKAHVNWMTDSSRNYTNDVHNQYNHHQPPCSSSSSYVSAVTPAAVSSTPLFQGPTSVFRGNEEYNQKADIFFAHPPDEHRSYLWHTPEFNVPQLLSAPPVFQSEAPIFPPPPPVQDTPSAVVVHHNKPTATQKSMHTNGADQYPSTNGNYFSVSHLVGNPSTGHKYPNNPPPANGPPPANVTTPGKWNKSSWELESGNKNNHSGQIPVKSHTGSKKYSAEALIGNNQLNYGDYNYNAIVPPVYTTRIESSHHPPIPTMQEPSTNPYPFFGNEFMQPPPLFPPAPTALPLQSESNGNIGNKPSATLKLHPSPPSIMGGGKSSGQGHKRRHHHQYENNGSSVSAMILPSNNLQNLSSGGGGGQHQPNYELGCSSSYLGGPSQPHHPPPPPPSFLINPDSFNYAAENCKLPATASHSTAHEINVTPSNFSSSYVANFNMSSICPEINNSIH